jgi:putative peptide zinc metalloprotease protein
MLPALRQELSLHPAAPAADGAPAWSLHDPVRNLYFRIDWLSFELLRRWRVGDAQRIARDVSEVTPIDAQVADVEALVGFLRNNQLLAADGEEATRQLLAQDRAAHRAWWHWLMHRYLFFRIPLWHPDAWLTRNLRRVAPLYSRTFLWISALVFGVSLVLVSRQWGVFRSSLLDLFSPASLLAVALVVVAVKVAHELGHAFTAKRFGCRVPTMGVAFLVLFPLAYTDVNDAWRLRSRRERLLVGAAGMLVELLLAVWATLAWVLLPDGALRGAAFIVATTTWVSTLLVNLSPFLRFDGYFLLMDALDMPNLHARSFALANWTLRRWLFASADAPPEPLPPPRRRALVVFAFATWAYRLVVFLGIALIVYHIFPQPLGMFMAGVEVYWFILQPLLRGLRNWPTELRTGWSSAAGRRWLWLLVALCALAVFPWQGQVSSQGILLPSRSLQVTAPVAGTLSALAADGQEVTAGAVVARLAVDDLAAGRERAMTRESVARWRAEVSGLDAKLRSRRGVLLADEARSTAEREGFEAQLASLALVADFAGRFRAADPDRRAGSWVAQGAVLGVVAAPGGWVVDAYAGERDVERVSVGDRGRFYPETAGSAPLDLRVERIEADAVHRLSEPLLASLHGGELLVRRQGDALVPERALYRVRLRVQGLPAALREHPQELRGRVVIDAARQALLTRYWQQASAVFVREAGL